MLHAACLLTRIAAISSAHIHFVSDAGSTPGAWIAAGRSGTAGIGVSGWTTAGGRGGGGIVGCMRGMVTVTCAPSTAEFPQSNQDLDANEPRDPYYNLRQQSYIESITDRGRSSGAQNHKVAIPSHPVAKS